MVKKDNLDLENMSGKEMLRDVLGSYNFKYGVFCIEVGIFPLKIVELQVMNL